MLQYHVQHSVCMKFRVYLLAKLLVHYVGACVC